MSRPQVGEGFLLVQQTTQLGNSLIGLFEVTVTKFEVSAELVSVWAAWKNRHDPHASIDIQQSKGVSSVHTWSDNNNRWLLPPP